MTGEPLYSIVASRAEALIASGEWSEGDRLPAERESLIDTIREAQDGGVQLKPEWMRGL